MPRLLLLHDHAPDFQTARAAGAVAARAGAGVEVVTRTIGAGGSFGGTISAAWRLRRDVRDFDLVHAFGPRALTAAAMAPVRRLIYSPADFPTRRHTRWLGAIAGYRDLRIICPTTTIHRAMVTAGLSPDRCHLIRPGVDFSRIRSRRDAALRKSLGFDDSHHVLLAPGESTRADGHDQAVWTAAILNVLDKQTRLLVWGRGPRAAAVRQFARRLGQPELVTLARDRLGRDVEFEELLPAVDGAIVSATGPVSTLPIAVCMAGNVPIAATVTSTVAELLEDRHTALMTKPGVPRLLARRILDLRADERLRWQMADTARTEAYEFYSQARFVEQMRSLYQQVIAGGAVEVEQPAPGGGSRFIGRG